MRGGDLSIAAGERIAQLRVIAESLGKYHDSYGAYPTDAESWEAFEPAADTLLESPQWSIRGDYVIWFERFGDGNERLLIEDPGIDWPGLPASAGRTPDRAQKWRCGLTTDLRLVRYDLVEGRIQFLDRYRKRRITLGDS
jgi:hypothetical protein